MHNGSLALSTDAWQMHSYHSQNLLADLLKYTPHKNMNFEYMSSIIYPTHLKFMQ